jgi:hypothetical protein
VRTVIEQISGPKITQRPEVEAWLRDEALA